MLHALSTFSVFIRLVNALFRLIMYNLNQSGVIEMSDDKHRARNKRYLDNTVDSIMVRVPKGQKEVIQQHADALGISLNMYMRIAVEEKIKRDDMQDSM